MLWVEQPVRTVSGTADVTYFLAYSNFELCALLHWIRDDFNDMVDVRQHSIPVLIPLRGCFQGFDQGNSTPSNEIEVAKEFMQFFKNWAKLFGIKITRYT